MFKTKVTRRGGERIELAFRNAKKARKTGVNNISIGYFGKKRYPNGTLVSKIAAIQQYGSPSQNIPARPFLTHANKDFQERLSIQVRNKVDRRTLVVTPEMAEELGKVGVDSIARAITQLKRPPLAASTIRKKGHDDPLIDTGLLRDSAEYEIN